MHLHILGICGTFMGGIALLARAAGHRVTGSDEHVYPPMSTQLAEQGIEVWEGYDPAQLKPAPDVVVVGNVMSRGNPAIEYTLEQGLPYTSGPAWLAEHVLADRWVLAVAGTHGKTSVASLLAWILEHAGLEPGFLVGGVPKNFGLSARLGQAPFFVVEADEYDTAFFDKRSKFVHYRPRTLVLNNLEFDHADIFDDLPSIQRQFHHLVRTVPGNGLILVNGDDPALAEVLEMGCWTPVERFGEDPSARWQGKADAQDPHAFSLRLDGRVVGQVHWSLLGDHNRMNGVASIAAAYHAGVTIDQALSALSQFEGIKRRLEIRGVVNGITVYDDFAHHPTAVASTIAGLQRKIHGGERLIAVLEPRSNTMRMGVHKAALAPALAGADRVFLYRCPDLDWNLDEVADALRPTASIDDSIESLVRHLVGELVPGDHVLVMSNGGFGGLHERLIQALGVQES
jgi:UDP-N-acetylmuramate: L-alanyl-gamma-D-glutamyl-meso-diaminopimelate ligase